MTLKFRRVALIGKYQPSAAPGMSESSLLALEKIADFMTNLGCEVLLEAETAQNTGLTEFQSIQVEEMATCDVGLVVGGIWALCAGIFAKLGFTGFLAAAILAAVPFLVTGFFHLDGFLDCCDAILSRRDLATRQKILKDSRVGAFAVVSAVLLFLLSFAALADCSFSLIWRALLLIPVVTRCMAGVAVETFAPMQTSQYAGSFAAGKTKTQRRILLGMYIAVMLVVFLWLFSKPSCALAVAWAGLTTILACRLARRNLGGMSGDIAGFSITLGELSGLLILAIF